MAGLIPLMLRPSEPTKRPSPSISTSFQPSHLRSASTGTVQTPRPNLPKRYSQLPPANLPVIPYTQAEWRKAISEVKRQHMSRRYRACSARCAEILDNLKDASQVEPAYLIYLHFYAAASMEMCTRPLPLTSPYRAALLQQARNHYDRAASLIRAAEDSVAVKTRSGSASSSCPPSLHSPSGSVGSLSSVSSRAWTAETSVPSPTNSVYSFDEPSTPQSSPRRHLPPKRVKKVSFSLPLCAEELEEQERESAANFRFPEPIIRPDSPTLGFDDEYFHAGASMRDLPPPPPPPKSSLRIPPPVVTDLPLLRPGGEGEGDDDDDFFRVERSVHRYNETLSHLRSQLANHSHNLGAQLVLAADMGSRPSSPATSPRSPTFERANADAARAAEKQARIERLRKNGWVRKRFDSRRYEELAREVLAELEP
ncbi:hypothetical protein CONLIGDRAFT_8068 [Coniochaeta ligniaria NRRL 30616]|uniref:Uncharacterized protein n=1 Tax=Coniochaeta ligniaria NRRL 30616 TaxID=1408157 RepID=A0A1J7J4Z7_9PEZI|nr:hypothetical protein CONLIGDRAFT_8068 [Coniochaeta ligniaria NRRL 30616]